MNERKILIEVTPEEYEKIKNGALDDTTALSDLHLLNLLLKKVNPRDWVEGHSIVLDKAYKKNQIIVSYGKIRAEIVLTIEGES